MNAFIPNSWHKKLEQSEGQTSHLSTIIQNTLQYSSLNMEVFKHLLVPTISREPTMTTCILKSISSSRNRRSNSHIGPYFTKSPLSITETLDVCPHHLHITHLDYSTLNLSKKMSWWKDTVYFLEWKQKTCIWLISCPVRHEIDLPGSNSHFWRNPITKIFLCVILSETLWS